jgi:ubiquinone/menaquinone biosynthesis C-methylase UbiE
MKDASDTKYSELKQTWQSPEKAAAYRMSRTPERSKRFSREESILGAWLDILEENSRVLDIPCGTGRCLPSIVRRKLRYIGADISPAMIAEAQDVAQHQPHAELVQEFVVADAEHLQFADNSVDCVVMWRFLHHVRDPKIRQNIFREAARVSRSMILISFHHPLSFTNLRKCLQRFFSGDTHGSAAFTQWRLAREALDCGLRLTETKSFRKYVSINWFACLMKLSA